MRIAPTSAVRRPAIRSTAVCLVLALALGLLAVSATGASAAGRTLYVRVGGSGDCSAPARACGSIDEAFSAASSGDHIQLAAGTYPSQKVESARQRSETFAANVVVEPAPGAAVTVKSLTPTVHHLTLRGLTVTGVVMTERAVASRNLWFESMTFANATVFLRGLQGGGVIDSTFRDGINRDAMNVSSGSANVLVARNQFVDYRWDPNKPNADVHIDCIQVFGVTRLTIDSNTFDNCSHRGLIAHTTKDLDIDGLVVKNNFFGPCQRLDNNCQTVKVPFQVTGQVASHKRDPSVTGTIRDVTLVNNHIVGWAYVEDMPGLEFANNVLERFFHEVAGAELCGSPSESANLVVSVGKCSRLAPSDRTYSQFRASAAPDIGFADPALAPPIDHDGNPRCGKPDVGAFEVQCTAGVAAR